MVLFVETTQYLKLNHPILKLKAMKYVAVGECQNYLTCARFTSHSHLEVQTSTEN